MEKSGSTDSLKMLPDSGKIHVNRVEAYCLSVAYLAPVAYYAVLANADHVLLEQHEHFVKQSYRNRCVIATANGLMDLTIPIEKTDEQKSLIRDVRVSNHGNWQINHWRSIASAYSSSPFFEYYVDDLSPFYEKKWDFLWDFNLALQTKILELIDVQPNIVLTQQYSKIQGEHCIDLRERIHPKKENYVQDIYPYYQVFGHKHGFRNNLSIIDLLFNMGNESILLLKKYINQ